ncbi:LytTR family DNA-binding domain-containing protein [Aquimarina sp. 2201CG5-10]|uniref:LytR/AlgR family response regulator transcription factor n=1 Tax=Aquimarina callyspongiae TaxID=3098150 RepID=UPI002AB54401|nr:LytTR family DNA-binding domain-containing protein [Aquimarina sp. 2201CG5-10]MDY8137470.1 LytTR family DNA-binding domain-containing protein [Aquimarina sp. 2201CG5-10]
MIRVVILEDEAPARKKLNTFLQKTEESFVVVKEIETVHEALTFFNTISEIDLILSDIELRDGNVFEIYNQIKVTAPIIFVTAYDHFWMNAFETNGIEYLLKPYSFSRFEKALQKFNSLKNNLSATHNDIFQKIDAYYQSKIETQPTYKEYIPVKSTGGIYFLKVTDITFIQSDYGVIFAFDSSNKKHLLNQTSLKEIQEILNPNVFFKINRSELVNKSYIEKINRYTKNTVAIHIKAHILKTSQNNTASFNSWIGIK